MKFGTPASLLALGATVAFLAPFAAAAAAAAPAPTGIDSASGAITTDTPFKISIINAAGEETVREIDIVRSPTVASTNNGIVSDQWTAELTFTPEEVVGGLLLRYSIDWSYPMVYTCYAITGDGKVKRLGENYSTIVMDPERVTCAMIYTGSFLDAVFARVLDLPSAGTAERSAWERLKERLGFRA